MEPDVPVKVEMVWMEDVTSLEHHEGAVIVKTEPTLEEVTWCVPNFEEDFTTQDTSQESCEEQLAVSCCAETNLKDVAALSVIEASIPSDCSSSWDEDEDFSCDDVEDNYDDDDDEYYSYCYTPPPLGIIRSESSSCSDEGNFLSGNIKQPVCCECTAEKQPAMWGKCERPQQATVFCSVTGPAAHVRDMLEPTPYRLFKLFISDDIIDGIVMQTNLHAEEQYQNSGKSFISTTNKEIETFIGINILMSIKPQANYRDYWSSAPDLHDSYISTLMTMNRFGWLLSHFQPNDTNNIPKRGEENYDKLCKLRTFFHKVAGNFKNAFHPSAVIGVDESVIMMKARSLQKQCSLKKRGYKVWVLADKTGYALKFEVYTGKVSRCLRDKVVKHLLQDLHGKHHRVYLGSYLTSTALLEDLKKKQTGACGSVIISKQNLPKLKDDKELKCGEYDWSVSDTGLCVVKWKDKRVVHLLSNFHDPQVASKVLINEKNGSTVKVPCPKLLFDYNTHVNCVHRYDQRKSVYEIDCRSRKWWHRIFWYFIDASIVNAFVLHKAVQAQPLNMKNFRREVSKELVSQALVAGRKKTKQVSDPVEINQKKPCVPKCIRTESSAHLPQRTTRRRCAKCSTKKRQMRTDWICCVCQVPLCLGRNKTCFQDYHAA